MKTVAVIGSRTFRRLKLVHEYVGKLPPGTKVISGGARGADKEAIRAAQKAKLPWEEFKAAWEDLSHPDCVLKTRPDGTQYDALAGHRRNLTMVQLADEVVAFWNGISTGTKNTIKHALRLNKSVTIVDEGGKWRKADSTLLEVKKSKRTEVDPSQSKFDENQMELQMILSGESPDK